ncbi:hypothetical protein HHX47_DHR7000171 [Lentinula edodes]|nr:hypothetical protein HHX47_DHR7000171 [Lentinula edodes]
MPFRYLRASTTSSTSYSSSSPTTSGGGSVFRGCVGNWGSWYGDRCVSLKTLWTLFHVRGMSSLYELDPIFSRTLNGPNRLSPSFFIGRSVVMLVPSSQTLSPALYSIASFRCLSYWRFMSSAAFLSADPTSSLIRFILSANSCAVGFCDVIFGVVPLYGCLPLSA